MFSHSAAPLPLSEASLHSLCASLNAPVVHTDELGAVPSRAAIVVYAEDYGNLALAVALRDLESGRVAVYHFRDAIPDPSRIPEALEQALRFAEGLGFLFDEDMIDAASGRGRRQAFEHWLRLTGAGAPPASPTREDAADTALELLPPDETLVEPIDSLLEPAEPAARQPGTASRAPALAPVPAAPAETGEAEAPRPALTKFRARASAEPEPGALVRPADSAVEVATPDGGGQALGRIAIVKRRRGEEAARKGILSRLLASF